MFDPVLCHVSDLGVKEPHSLNKAVLLMSAKCCILWSFVSIVMNKNDDRPYPLTGTVRSDFACVPPQRI